jgi:endogenous inhibitor of DNA gyrase (YacG/DUF329 family)
VKPPVCPICKKAPPQQAYEPFCSRRCADVDLNRWFTGRYAIPAAEPEDGEGREGGANPFPVED